MKPIIIYGSKSYSKIIEQIIKDCNRQFLGFIDDFENGEKILGDFEAIKTKYSVDEVEIALGIGYSDFKKRKALINKVGDFFKLATLIHPNSYIADSAIVGEGSVIMAGAHIDYNVSIGKGVVCWPKSIINHDTYIKGNTFISPGVTVCGFVKIGESCFVGANSTIVDHTIIKDNSFIKAHSLIFEKQKL